MKIYENIRYGNKKKRRKVIRKSVSIAVFVKVVMVIDHLDSLGQ